MKTLITLISLFAITTHAQFSLRWVTIDGVVATAPEETTPCPEPSGNPMPGKRVEAPTT